MKVDEKGQNFVAWVLVRLYYNKPLFILTLELNKLYKEKSANELNGILGYKDSFLQSSDLIGSTFSCVLDSNYTDVIDGNFVKLTGWYDNEWGYSSRLVDLVERLSKLF